MRTADDVIADEILGRLPHGKTVSVGHHRRVVFAILCEVATYLSIRSDAPDDLKVNFISVLDEVMAWESDNMKEHYKTLCPSECFFIPIPPGLGKSLRCAIV